MNSKNQELGFSNAEYLKNFFQSIFVCWVNTFALVIFFDIEIYWK